MNKRVQFSLMVSTLALLSGCINCGDGRLPESISDLIHPPCADSWKQTQKNYDVTIDLAQKANISGKITESELIKISEDAANCRAQAKDLCELLHEKSITFEQYQRATIDLNGHCEKMAQLLQAKLASVSTTTPTPVAGGNVTLTRTPSRAE